MSAVPMWRSHHVDEGGRRATPASASLANARSALRAGAVTLIHSQARASHSLANARSASPGTASTARSQARAQGAGAVTLIRSQARASHSLANARSALRAGAVTL